jgi:hypothetical protein
LGCDPGVNNIITIAERVLVGEGNRLGGGARCANSRKGDARAAGRRQGRRQPPARQRRARQLAQ